MASTPIVFRKPQTFDIPIIGDQLAKINHAIDLWANPCMPNAEIWIYGLFHSVPTLAISLLKPEIIDLNIEHRGRKPRKGKKLRFIPDILFRDALVEIPVPKWHVFQVYEFSQRIGWYFLVLDATTDFVINWQTMAYQWQGCQEVNPPPYFIAEIPAASSMTGFTDGWFPLPWGFTTQHRIVPLTNPVRARILDTCIPLFRFSGNFKPFAGSPAARVTGWRIRSSVAPQVVFERQLDPALGFDINVSESTIPFGEYPAGTEFWMEIHKLGGAIGTNGLTFSMTSSRAPWHTPFGPDP